MQNYLITKYLIGYTLKLEHFGYIQLSKVYYLIYFINVATKIFKIIYVACILSLLDSADLVSTEGKRKSQNKEPKNVHGLIGTLIP